MTFTVAIASTERGADRSVPLLVALGADLDLRVVPWSTVDGETTDVDLVVTTAASALPAIRSTIVCPVVAWADDAASAQALAANADVVVLAPDPRLAEETNAPFAGADSVELDRWPPLLPLLRARWRERLGLPESLVISVDSEEVDAFTTTALAVATAAVVTGPAVAVALALGTPLVTGPDDAARLGLPAGAAIVVEDPADRDRIARGLASSADELAERSVAAHRAAKALDLAPALAAVRGALRPSTDHPQPNDSTRGRLHERLAEIGTLPRSRAADRASDAISAFRTPPGSDPMPHPAIDPAAADRLRNGGAAADTAATAGTDPIGSTPQRAAARAKRAARKVAGSAVDKARRAIEASSRAEVDALHRDLADLRSELGRVRTQHQVELAALHHQLDELRASSAPDSGT